MPEKEVQENLLKLQPVPENFGSVKKMDDFLQPFMKQRFR